MESLASFASRAEGERMGTQLGGARAELQTQAGLVGMYRLRWLPRSGGDPETLPHTIKILIENLLRRAGTRNVADRDVLSLLRWPDLAETDIAFMPSRVLMQDFTGVPAVVDFAAMRSAVARGGGDPGRINPLVPVDLVIDHSVQVDAFGSAEAYEENIEIEYRRNAERYSLLRWAQQAFEGFRVVPPGMGIVHQVNLEHLAQVVSVRNGVAMPETLVGTDSHTTMINGLGVLGWGVGGIEAEAAMLGQPMFLPWPVVVGVRVHGALQPGTTATDLVLTLTQTLRAYGVVGKFVEFFGPGLSNLELADRATLSNMCPEYGATAAYFPVDQRTLSYLALTGRDQVDLVERYTKGQGLFRTDTDPDPRFSEVVELDLSAVVPSLAGPRRPQDRVPLQGVARSFSDAYPEAHPSGADVDHGSVVITAITSCTNTSNPSVMLAAGLLAKKAVEAGLATKPWVKTSLAPGSRVVTDYLDRAGLTPYLEKLGFFLVGYGCTTCIGNSGPLPEGVAMAVDEGDLVVASVISGNRNFEGRVHPQVRASYLASPPLVVAYALAGRIDIDLTQHPLGVSEDGQPVRLEDVWPTGDEIREAMTNVTADGFETEYARVFDGDDRWRSIPSPTGPLYEWDEASTYVKEPPFFDEISHVVTAPGDIVEARVLVMVGDSVTTDHISPAGSITADSPAGRYLESLGVARADFNSYGSRRGNHEVLMRGTFANIRLRNMLTPEREGAWTVHLPDGAEMSVFDAAMLYRDEGVPLVIIAGKEYGSGSSRDWAAKGPALLGVRMVLAESYERIHRSNLIGMGILPLQFAEGDSAAGRGLTGRETIHIRGLGTHMVPRSEVIVQVRREDGNEFMFPAVVRIDGPAEVEYFRQGGILRMVMRRMASGRPNI
jgi:aconitate hydratase